MRNIDSEFFIPPAPELAQGISTQDSQPEGITYITGSILEMWAIGEKFPPGIRRYLTVSTRGLLVRALRGFYASFDKTRFPPKEAVAHFLEEGRTSLETLENGDYVDFGHVEALFQLMPVVYGDIGNLPERLSYKSVFTAPITTTEHYERLIELRQGVGRIAHGIDTPKDLSVGRSAVLRTVAFFGASKLVQQTASNTADNISPPSVN